MATDRPQAIERLALLDCNLPGVTPSPPVFQGKADTTHGWHFMFNQLDDLPDILVQGREREFLTWLYTNYGYRPETIAQNHARMKVRLPMPILTLGGEFGTADAAETTLKPQADNLQGGVLRGCGHYVAEECPQMVLEKLVPFLTKR